MMRNRLFDMDNPFWRWTGRIPEIVILSLCWLLCCIPVITILPSCCALFDAVSRNLMRDEPGCFRRFFRSFWRELKQGIPLTILWLIIVFLAFTADRLLIYYAQQIEAFVMFSIMHRIMMILTLGYLMWIVALQSRYQHKFMALHLNALRFMLGRLPGTAGMLLSAAAVIFVCFLHPFTHAFLLAAPCLIAIFHTKPVEKAFSLAFPIDYADGAAVSSE